MIGVQVHLLSFSNYRSGSITAVILPCVVLSFMDRANGVILEQVTP